MIKLVAVFIVAYSAGACAGGAFEIAHKSGCIGCHRTDKDLVGPSFENISRTYNVLGFYDPREESARLRKKLRVGGKMPPRVITKQSLTGECPPARKTTSDADIELLVSWIMGLTPVIPAYRLPKPG